MFDVFYFGAKPNLFEFEQPATNLAEAASKCKTGFFWYIYGLNDYTGFNWDFHPAPWQSTFVHVWPNQWQSDGQVYLVNSDHVQGDFHYHDNHTVHRLPNREYWHIPDNIDRDSINWTWCPDPADPPYVYHVPSQHQSASGACYRVPGAIADKLIDNFVVNTVTTDDNWHIPDHVQFQSVDQTWHPNPLDPPYIYHFPSQHQSASGVIYTVPGATEVKLVDHIQVQSQTDTDHWHLPDHVNPLTVDFTWHPNPLDPPYIYHFPSQHQSASGVIYTVPGATEVKLVDFFQVARLVSLSAWSIPKEVDMDSVDFTWHPNPLDPPYIYHFPSQHQSASGVIYTVPGATEVKLSDAFSVTYQKCTDHWTLPKNTDVNSVDFTWHPNPLDPPYIYHFPSQHQSASGVIYTVPGATEVKLVDHMQVLALPTKTNWRFPKSVDPLTVDFTWHPNPLDPPYIYHFPSQHQSASGVIYTVPGATEVKLSDAFSVTRLVDMTHWTVPDYIDHDSVDYSWHPNHMDPSYVYHFPSQHQSASGVIYKPRGASEIKVLHDHVPVLALSNPGDKHWHTDHELFEFDYSWHPDVLDPAFEYVFGNQWNPSTIEATVFYRLPGATEVKHVEHVVAHVKPDWSKWRILDEVADFDYSWRPNPTSPPYIYVFGNQWMSPEVKPSLEYVVPGATERKYMSEPRAKRVPKPKKFETLLSCDFDYSWEPDPGSPPYIYVFGNQWYPSEKMPTVQYIVPGATERKHMSEPQALLHEHDLIGFAPLTDLPFDFDYSWRPDPDDPPLIYQFGNQWYPAVLMPTVEYRVLGATRIKYVDTDLIKATLLPNLDCWEVPENIDISNIDFSWCPNPKDPVYEYHFATPYQISSGLVYKTPGASEPKFLNQTPVVEPIRTVVGVFDIFFVDKLNPTSQTRFERLQQKYPGIQKIRYANSMIDTIKRCAGRTTTSKFWVIGSEYNYDDFDFAWHAHPWQSYMTHVFPSQWQKWSDTFLINKWEFERHTVWAQSLEQFPNLNFVQDQQVVKPENLSNIYYVDHGNPESRPQYESLRIKNPDMVITRFVDNYLATFKRIVATAETEYVWIINGICDYANFDFTWQPEPWQAEMIHVFPSSDQSRGDTFYIHVSSFTNQMVELELLDWFNVINYCKDQTVRRFDLPRVKYSGDNLVEQVQNHDFKYPYTLFTDNDYVEFSGNPCLWSEKDRTVQRFTKSGASALIPRDIKKHLKTQIYDYPYIKDSTKTNIMHIDPEELDIVFISNGEPDADRWYENLLETVAIAFMPSYLKYKIKRVSNVHGRVAAYQAAAKVSDTPWFFAVFAKLDVSAEFNWSWQPDYFQEPKHYIFNAHNPVNGLEYGHQGMIAYNKKLVLENSNPGLDFTLTQPHESVPILSGVARFNQDAWMTWRTAFREVIKLRHFQDTNPTVETEHRLSTWLNTAQGDYAEQCLKGAHDAMAYYESVSGDYEKLKLSFEWDWLRERFNSSN